MSPDRRRRKPSRECVYCGRLIDRGTACAEHAPLQAADPSAIAAGPPLTESQLGVGNQHRVPKRGGRAELY